MIRFRSRFTAGQLILTSGLLVFGSVVASSQQATALPNPTITSITETPDYMRGGDIETITINGQTSGWFSFSGCYASQGTEGFWYTSDFNENEFYEAEITSHVNTSAHDITFQSAGYEGVTCPLDGSLPTSTPTWTVPSRTITPSMEIDPVTVGVGTPYNSPIPYTLHGPGGATHINMDSGARFELQRDASCEVFDDGSLDSSMPAGLGIDSTVSPAGEQPELRLTGSAEPGTNGSYRVCLIFTNGNFQANEAWMTISVQDPALANTGRDVSSLATFGGAAVLLVVMGAMFIVRRHRRSTSQRA